MVAACGGTGLHTEKAGTVVVAAKNLAAALLEHERPTDGIVWPHLRGNPVWVSICLGCQGFSWAGNLNGPTSRYAKSTAKLSTRGRNERSSGPRYRRFNSAAPFRARGGKRERPRI